MHTRGTGVLTTTTANAQRFFLLGLSDVRPTAQKETMVVTGNTIAFLVGLIAMPALLDWTQARGPHGPVPAVR